MAVGNMTEMVELDDPKEFTDQDTSLRSLEGTLQRVNYLKKEMAVVAAGQVWHFTVEPDSELWFDDQKAILRCFHSLDRVRVLFTQDGICLRLRALYSWERNN
jgi:hypothetical protein